MPPVYINQTTDTSNVEIDQTMLITPSWETSHRWVARSLHAKFVMEQIRMTGNEDFCKMVTFYLKAFNGLNVCLPPGCNEPNIRKAQFVMVQILY